MRVPRKVVELRPRQPAPDPAWVAIAAGEKPEEDQTDEEYLENLKAMDQFTRGLIEEEVPRPEGMTDAEYRKYRDAVIETRRGSEAIGAQQQMDENERFSDPDQGDGSEHDDDRVPA